MSYSRSKNSTSESYTYNNDILKANIQEGDYKVFLWDFWRY